MAGDKLLTAQDVFELPTSAETVVFYVSLGVALTSLFPLGYAVWFRSFPPIKAQHVGITVTIGIGGIIFIISYNLMEGMAMYNGALGYCTLWGAWAVFTFGLAIFISAIFMRLVLLYRVFISGTIIAHTNSQVYDFSRKFWPFFAMWLPSLVSSIVVSSIKGPRGAWLLEDHGLRACTFSDGYLMWIYVYFIVMILISWVLYFRTRKVAQAFNSFHMAIWTLIVFTVILIVSMVINLIKGSNSPWGRITIALTNMVMINGYIWLIFGSPVIGHLFWREQTMRNFMNTLHKDSLVAQQAYNTETRTNVNNKSGKVIQPDSIYCPSVAYSEDMRQQDGTTNTSQFEYQNLAASYSAAARHML
ncbi:hypothetical protein BX661DRAFT_195231 [Kickxella alabastrina]|uniref:uncharacterized protein n=1 Tax=Kickxella alabastrina TaxID=61397 RepID=UPI00221EA7B3|nr:uncharacterized protein BX661DRAFT_195231 [Kickxella alabastrina]KAI7834609.1 hypothetical protein BX661DRAFT_195231 [Kickxella alabastrina]KAJ1945195.1 hypothetical protein GGF37_001814 [Kickxella alabastrina]